MTFYVFHNILSETIPILVRFYQLDDAFPVSLKFSYNVGTVHLSQTI